jgi:hypothetical protein
MRAHKYIAVILITTIIIAPISAKSFSVGDIINIPNLGNFGGNSEEYVPTSNPKLESKETGFTVLGVNIPFSWDGLANKALNMIVQRMVRSITEWVVNRDGRGPAFVHSPIEFYRDIADGLAGEFIEGSDLGFLCSPFRNNISQSLSLHFGKTRTPSIKDYSCRLTDIIDNVEAFNKGKFIESGGWDTWFRVSQNPANNPRGAFLEAKFEIDSRIIEALGVKKEELSWAKGFLSTQDCNINPNTGKEECGPVKTPGTLIENQFNKSLGSGWARIELADEFDELLVALLDYAMDAFIGNKKSVFSQEGLYNPALSTDGGPVIAVSCGATPRPALVDRSVIWTATRSDIGAGYSVSYTWEGEGISGATGATATTTYQTAGTKTARVTAVLTDSNGLNRGPTVANCSTIIIDTSSEQFGDGSPLATTCWPALDSIKFDPNDRVCTNEGFCTERAVVHWVALITGGSGSISSISITPNVTGVSAFENGDIEFYPTGSYLGSIQIYPPGTVIQNIMYTRTGTYRSKISVVDHDNSFTPITDQMCDGTVNVTQ